jgi:hypothetical protein
LLRRIALGRAALRRIASVRLLRWI